MRKTEKVFLFLLFAVTIAIRPAIAQDFRAGARTLDLELASDDELTQALDKAGDIELINKADGLTEVSVPGVSVPGQETAWVSVPGVSVPEQEPARRENAYLLQSRRLARLAEDSFAEGNYDMSASFADEAAWLARQSDVYVAITEAKRCLDQAAASGVPARFPQKYKEAENWYEQSAKARESEEWDAAIDAANMVAQLLESPGASVRNPSGNLPAGNLPAGNLPTGNLPAAPLPATYTVRSWSVSKDCFWNIAGLAGVYGNPRQWTALYNANKSKLPDPNNPDTLEPGIVLDIPSINGEPRQGAWESGRDYEPLN